MICRIPESQEEAKNVDSRRSGKLFEGKREVHLLHFRRDPTGYLLVAGLLLITEESVGMCGIKQRPGTNPGAGFSR